MTPAKIKSRYSFELQPPYQLPSSEEWSALAWLRVGRVVKFAHRAPRLNAVPYPISDDGLAVCAELALFNSGGRPGLEQLADVALALDLVDQRKLEEFLADRSWAEVIELRRYILPKVGELRRRIVAALDHRRPGELQLSDARQVVVDLHSDLERARAEVEAKWRELGMAALLTLGGGVAGDVVTSNLVAAVLPGSWLSLAARAVSWALIGASTLKTEIRQLYTATRRVSSSPLLFFEKVMPP
jgi:hypothetical protein